jgi:isopropylmalate/homocitrate/citramalate synthase
VHPLIHDWNRTSTERPRAIMLDDETLRDGLQSPSVRCPGIDEKLRILHLIDRLGIDTADIGLPGAGPHVVADVQRLAREIADAKLRVTANCAARTLVADIRPIAEVSQRVGIPIECCAFIGSSPLRRYAEGWTLEQLQRLTEEAIAFAVGEGLPVMYVTEDTTRADPETLRALYSTAIRAGASRVCIADTVGHATTAATSASTGTGTAIGTSRSPTRSQPSTPAPRGCTAPRSGSASASVTRPWTCCSSTWC